MKPPPARTPRSGSGSRMRPRPGEVQVRLWPCSATSCRWCACPVVRQSLSTRRSGQGHMRCADQRVLFAAAGQRAAWVAWVEARNRSGERSRVTAPHRRHLTPRRGGGGTRPRESARAGSPTSQPCEQATVTRVPHPAGGCVPGHHQPRPGTRRYTPAWRRVAQGEEISMPSGPALDRRRPDEILGHQRLGPQPCSAAQRSRSTPSTLRGSCSPCRALSHQRNRKPSGSAAPSGSIAQTQTPTSQPPRRS
jgi:hypothetical protein